MSVAPVPPGAPPEVPAPRRRRRRRVVIGAAAVLLLIGGLAVLRPPFLTRWATRTVVGAVMRSVPRDVAVVPALSPRPAGGMTTVLVVGNDTREELPDDAVDRFGPLTGKRADLIAVVAIDPEGGEARALSLPRELRAEVPGYGPLLLAEAFGFGGSPALVGAVEQVTGLAVHRYAEFTFRGFARAVDRLGGVTLEFCQPGRDVPTGFAAAAGALTLDGEQATAFVRSRAYEVETDGAWLPAQQGDDGRVARQQVFGSALLDEIRDGVSPGAAFGLFRDGESLAVVDAGLGTGTVVDALDIVRSGEVAVRSFPAAPLLTQAERTSPFGPPHLGARQYLVAAAGAADALAWFSGVDGGLPPSTAPAPAAAGVALPAAGGC